MERLVCRGLPKSHPLEKPGRVPKVLFGRADVRHWLYDVVLGLKRRTDLASECACIRTSVLTRSAPQGRPPGVPSAFLNTKQRSQAATDTQDGTISGTMPHDRLIASIFASLPSPGPSAGIIWGRTTTEHTTLSKQIVRMYASSCAVVPFQS